MGWRYREPRELVTGTDEESGNMIELLVVSAAVLCPMSAGPPPCSRKL